MGRLSKVNKIREIAQTGAKLDEKRSAPLRLAVVGSDSERFRLICDLLVPLTSRAAVDKIVLGDDAVFLDDGVELAVVVVDEELSHIRPVLEQIGRRHLPLIAARSSGASHPLLPTDEQLRRAGVGKDDVVDLDVGDDEVSDALFDVMLRRLPAKKLALCANFEGARSHAAKAVISATAWQNGVIAGAVFIPGADLPVLTGNQVKMVLELAAIYGKQMTFARAKELVAVVGAGYTLRTVAREALGFVPGPGWLLKASIAYGGTIAMGKAAQRYFISGEQWGESVRRRLAEARRGGDRHDSRSPSSEVELQ